jgi:hypothetical protein
MFSNEVDAMNRFCDAVGGLHGPDQQRIAQVGLDWMLTLLAKNADYGGSAWAVPTLCPKLECGDAILVRMSDKISRIANLLKADSKALVDESIEDTIKDLGAYCLLWLARPKDQSQKAKDVIHEEASREKPKTPKLAKECRECHIYKNGDCDGQEEEGCRLLVERT